jgi:hypothetical protein
MIQYFVLLLILIVIIWVFKKNIEPFSNFINFNLTEKPVANYAPYNIYQWWKYGQNFDQYKGCDQYRCQSNHPVAGYTKPKTRQLHVHFKDSDERAEYYENSAKYCMNNPHSDLCPALPQTPNKLV